MKRVLIIAGESSGDLHGSSLMNRMKAIMPDIEFKGIGGKLMIEEGLEAVRHVSDLNFMGLVEVIRHLPFIRHTMKELISLLD
ncbi:lipid-A-disaccharide synthase, partial [bacterium]|nr:lipid-A-disaccharide synthase [bacterium]